ncbi:BLUF domain-containing protein [Alteraurantiacibacter buctensis]|uniref:Blue light sensor protein n=1 Tax=Alteraurantiacibacter buctensis TaxID=1503981 RepID=A0A844YSI8_9SPHN|nr:BLUF domain-containing protein [Alteraurantiacibacter buctensis]MXO70050.1 blue light sensor protein [Alteraurantiacibacter buctensis]
MAVDETRPCRLLYTSKAAGRATVGSQADPAVIAAQSANKNSIQGITGSLLLIVRCYIQILEGPTANVEETFERICRDFRHRELQLVDMVNVKERLFPEWSMACIGGSEQARLAMREELEEIRFLTGVNATHAAEQMRTLLDRGVS